MTGRGELSQTAAENSPRPAIGTTATPLFQAQAARDTRVTRPALSRASALTVRAFDGRPRNAGESGGRIAHDARDRAAQRDEGRVTGNLACSRRFERNAGRDRRLRKLASDELIEAPPEGALNETRHHVARSISQQAAR